MQLAPLCLSEVHTGSGGGLGLDRVRCMGLSRVGGPEARLWLFGLRRACVVLSSSSSQGIPRKQTSAACILSNRKCKSQGTAIMINSRPIVTLIMDSNDECDRGGLYNYFLESGKELIMVMQLMMEFCNSCIYVCCTWNTKSFKIIPKVLALLSF